jgi:alkylation response protein AidB-like acyl-CoA dehydrogenase
VKGPMDVDVPVPGRVAPAGPEADPGEADFGTFRARARQWLVGHMDRLAPGTDNETLIRADEYGERARALQERLAGGGYAGLCFPRRYGGQGLSPAHQEIFTDESLPYEMPTMLNVPSLAILAPTLMDFGTEEQKRRHLPMIIGGREIWVQLLSEPGSGSDLASVTTSAVRDGDVFIVNGSKIWTSGAHRADYALCLARTDWQAPKHHGLTMFIVKVHQPGIEITRITRVNGNADFCQEFFTDVVVPATDVLGTLHDGWAVATRLLSYEREAAGGASPYISGSPSAHAAGAGLRADIAALARAAGLGAAAVPRQLVAEAWVGDVVHQQLIERVTSGVRSGRLAPAAGALIRLSAAVVDERRVDIALDVAGPGAVTWTEAGPGARWGTEYIYRQGGSLAGGSNEMQRNLISERLLGMPREWAADLGKPFSDVRHNAPAEHRR